MRRVERDSNKGCCDILLIHPCYHRRLGSGIVPPIGLAYLASFLRKVGFTPKILDCALYFDSVDKLTIEKMQKWLRRELSLVSPRLAIGIGPCTTPAIRSILAIADTCRDIHPQLPLIFGGPLTFIPGQEWLFFERLEALAVVKGDGEYPLSRLLTRLREGGSISDIPGVQTSENQNIEPYLVNDLDCLSYPAWDVFKMDSYRPSVRRDLFVSPFASVVGSRGCAYHCSFCISGQLIEYRRHSFEYITREVEFLNKKYGVCSIIFYDDSLFANKSKINDELTLFAELLSQSASRGIFWQIETRPDIFSQISHDTFEYIFARGCHQLNIGIEKVSFPQLTMFSKPFSIKKLRETCQLATNVCPGMRLTGTFILGGPGETLESIHETIQFSTQLGLLFAHYYPLELYPGTPMYHSVFGEDKRVWFDKIMNDKLPWGEIVYKDDNISATQLIELVHFAYRYFYERHEWKEMAKGYLSRNYEEIHTIVKSWQKDRFRLGRSDEM